jgi:hypothetical protein
VRQKCQSKTAAKYWYINYRVAEDNDQFFDKVRQFLANDERRTLWVHVEWLEGNKLASRGIIPIGVTSQRNSVSMKSYSHY